MQNWNLCCSTIWLSMHLRFVLGFFFLNKRSPEHLSYMPSAIRTLSLIQNACSYVRKVICVQLTKKKKIICHSTKPSFRVEVKEHVVRINCSQSFVTSLEGFYFPGAWKTYIKQDIQMIRTARVQSINSFASRKIFILKQQCLLP